MLDGSKLIKMAADAIPHDDNEWGSDRQVEAENTFCAAAKMVIPESEHAELTNWAEHATTEEIVTEYLRAALTAGE
jgi:hypothetical protein